MTDDATTAGGGPPDRLGGRRVVLKVALGALLTTVLAVTVWLVVTRTDDAGRYADLSAVPGVVVAGEAGDGRVRVLLRPGQDLDRTAGALVGLSEAADGRSVAVGVARDADDRDFPVARVVVGGGPLAGPEARRLAVALAVLARLDPEPLREATGGAVGGSPYADVLSTSSVVETMEDLVDAASGVPGGGALLDRTTVVESGGGVFYLRCGGLGQARRLVGELGAVRPPGRVGGGEGGCGRPLRVDVRSPDLDRAGAVRRAALRALGPRTSVSVRAGDVTLIGPAAAPASDGVPPEVGDDALVSLVAGLDQDGVRVSEVATDLSYVDLEATELGAVLAALQRFARVGEQRTPAPGEPAPQFRASVGQDEVRGPVGSLRRLLPLLRGLDRDGWRVGLGVSPAARPATTLVVTGEQGYDEAPLNDLAESRTRERLVEVLRRGGWRGEASLVLARIAGADDAEVLQLTTTPRGRARDVALPDGAAAGPARAFVAAWDRSAS